MIDLADEPGGHREQLRKVQAKLRATSSKCTELAQENSLLRKRTSPAAASPPVEDALTEQASPATHCLALLISGLIRGQIFLPCPSAGGWVATCSAVRVADLM